MIFNRKDARRIYFLGTLSELTTTEALHNNSHGLSEANPVVGRGKLDCKPRRGFPKKHLTHHKDVVSVVTRTIGSALRHF